MFKTSLIAAALSSIFAAIVSPNSISETTCPCQDDDDQPVVAGEADVLKIIPKSFATFHEYLPGENSVRLLLEGDDEPTTWLVASDAEVKVHGWWGRLEQFQTGDRVWVWFSIDGSKGRTGILMLADEISEGNIHGQTTKLKDVDLDQRQVTLETERVGDRVLTLADDLMVAVVDENIVVSQGETTLFTGSPGDAVYVQSAGNDARALVGMTAAEQLRQDQKEWMRVNWRNSGLPGTVGFLHPLSGEMEVMLDHESRRWGRYLTYGDQVTLKPSGSDVEIQAQVKSVQHWREKTRVHLVTDSGVDQLDLSVTQRLHMMVPEPPMEVQQSERPTDAGRDRTRSERIDWVLSTVYCPCRIRGDQCTGMFYTQASCSMTNCGMPRQMSEFVGDLIDEGKDDLQILDQLETRYGPQVHHQHLLR